MIILLLAGCSAETVAEEYHLSEQGLGPSWKGEAVSRLLRHPSFKGYDSYDGILRMVSAREDVMRAVVTMMERLWVSVEGFLGEVVGMDEGTTERAKDNLRDVDGSSWLMVSRPGTP